MKNKYYNILYIIFFAGIVSFAHSSISVPMEGDCNYTAGIQKRNKSGKDENNIFVFNYGFLRSGNIILYNFPSQKHIKWKFKKPDEWNSLRENYSIPGLSYKINIELLENTLIYYRSCNSRSFWNYHEFINSSFLHLPKMQLPSNFRIYFFYIYLNMKESFMEYREIQILGKNDVVGPLPKERQDEHLSTFPKIRIIGLFEKVQTVPMSDDLKKLLGRYEIVRDQMYPDRPGLFRIDVWSKPIR